MSDVSFPFQCAISEVEASIDQFAKAVIDTLESSFTTVPIGNGFVEYPVFEAAYNELRQSTENFQTISVDTLTAAITANSMTLIVVRTILGFTPGEWAHIATDDEVEVSEAYARSIDKRIRMNPSSGITINERIKAMIEGAVNMLTTPPPDVGEGAVHRLDKADTKEGPASIAAASRLGVPYAMLLYERLLGRPFATVRDAYSERVGDIMEVPIEDRLVRGGIPYRKTKHAERVTGFEQAPDFIVPDEFNPDIVIEAKITEDAGTARDKVTRIQHLHTLSRQREEEGFRPFHVIACIDGRGFATRREDMKKIIRATNGKVFTLRTLGHLIDYTPLSTYRTS